MTGANAWCAYPQRWAGWGARLTVWKGCSLETLMPSTAAAPGFNPRTRSARSAAQLCAHRAPALAPEPKHLHSLLSAVKTIHAMRGSGGWKHLGEEGVSPQSLEDEEGDVEQLLKKLGMQQSLWKGQARGVCLRAHVCNIFVASLTLLWQGGGLDDPQRSLPTPTIL